MPGTKFCRYCDAALPEDALFCNKCGKSLSGLAGDVPQSAPETLYQESSRNGLETSEPQADSTEGEGPAGDGEKRPDDTLDADEVHFCPYCGADAVENEKFCYNCGKDKTTIRRAHARPER
jgi:uncharacterized membrane protein YvbJ